jgi:hypothetical protein
MGRGMMALSCLTIRREIYLLASMTLPDYRDGLSAEDKGAVTLYLEEMQVGPADGNMDIEWQENCRGYYRHLEILEALRLECQEAAETYVTSLEKDIIAWLAIKPNNVQVTNVRTALSNM